MTPELPADPVPHRSRSDMKVVIVVVVVAGVAAAIRWSPLGVPIRRRWSTVVRTERPR
jgi:hypothetical protein